MCSDLYLSCNNRKIHSAQSDTTKYDFFMFLLNKSCSHLECRVEKVSNPGSPSNWLTLFGSNNYNQVSCSCRSDLCILGCLQSSFSSAVSMGCLVWLTLLRSCHSISVRWRLGIRLDPSRRRFFFCWSLLLLCFRSLSCCITHLLLSFTLLNRWPQVLLHTVLINWGIHSTVNEINQSKPWSS